MTPDPRTEETTPAPCRCHQPHAQIIPFHTGHCCFFPASQTCHQTEVAEWERQHALIFGARNV